MTRRAGAEEQVRAARRTLRLSLAASWGKPLAHRVDPRELLSLPLPTPRTLS